MITEEAAEAAQNKQNQNAKSAPQANDWLKERKRELDQVLDQKARELSHKAQSNVASRMQHYESALRSASTDLEGNEEPRLSSIADSAAKRLKESADYIENADPKELVDEGAKAVRTNPYVALGASLLIGLAIGKLARTASRDGAPENA